VRISEFTRLADKLTSEVTKAQNTAVQCAAVMNLDQIKDLKAEIKRLAKISKNVVTDGTDDEAGSRL
jgi:hypothetical protein